MNKNLLYEFELKQKQEVEEVDTQNDESGKEVKTIRKVEKLVPVFFAIEKPNRKMVEESDIFQSKVLSEYLKAGLMSAVVMLKMYENQDGIWSEKDKTRMKEVSENAVRMQAEFIAISNIKPEDRTEEQKEKYETLFEDFVRAKNELEDFKRFQERALSHTADAKARTKTIIWWILHLAKKKSGDNFVDFFAGKTHEEKLASYDAIEQGEDAFLRHASQVFVSLVTLWHNGEIETVEQFDQAMSFFRGENE